MVTCGGGQLHGDGWHDLRTLVSLSLYASEIVKLHRSGLDKTETPYDAICIDGDFMH